jgi:hypothetical protein
MFPVLWFVLWLVGLQPLHSWQGPRPNAASERASIEGFVIRAGAAAGAPRYVSDVRVELKPGNRIVTSSGGMFSFRNLEPGRYRISFARAGFIPLEDPRRGLTAAGLDVTLVAGQTLRNVELPMIAAPAIAGRVFGPHGEPVAAGLMCAYGRKYTPYESQLRIVKKAMTNDMGEFRLFGLNFGAYFVSAAYSDRDRAAALGSTQLSANISKADDGYATIFYDGSDDLSRAQPVRLAPGAEPATLNISLRDSPRFKIRGQVLPLAAGIRITLAPRGGDLTDSDYFVQPDASGTFEILSISPGEYLLLASAADGALSSDVMRINITDRDVVGIRLALEQTMLVSGAITVDRSSRDLLAGLRLKLKRSTTEFDQVLSAVSAPNGTFTFEHVVPSAEYDVAIDSLPSGSYIRSISSGGRDVLAGKSRLVANQPLQIALGATPDYLDVRVTKAGEAAPGVQVVLVPELRLRRRADRYVTDFTDQTGSVHLSSLPPGRYTAYAFERIESDAYYAFAFNPVSEGRFRDHATPVTVGEGGTKTIQLTVIPAEETAGGLQ